MDERGREKLEVVSPLLCCTVISECPMKKTQKEKEEKKRKKRHAMFCYDINKIVLGEILEDNYMSKFIPFSQDGIFRRDSF